MTANVEPWPPNSGIERLNRTRFADVRWVAETGSTNADLLELASRRGQEPVVLFTDHQVKGRGRQNRTWHDEPGDSLLVSALTFGDPAWASLVPLATGLAAVAALDRYLGVEADQSPVGIKWPNDVLAADGSDLKLAGILVEARSGAIDAGSTAASVAIVIGMGLNLRWSTTPPSEVRSRGTTLEILGRPHDGARGAEYPLPSSARNDLLIEYLCALHEMLDTLSAPHGVPSILAQLRARCLTLGRHVTFRTARGIVAGRAVDLGPEGELLVVDGSGREHSLLAGDAHHQPGGHPLPGS